MARPGKSGPVSFRYFRCLSPEIRLMIWELTVTAGIIDIYAFNKRLTSSQDRNNLKDDRIYISQRGIPLLFACHESRQFALSHYKHGLDTECQSSDRFQLRIDEFPAHVAKNWRGCFLPCRKNSRPQYGEIRPRMHFNLATDVVCLNRVWWDIGRHPLYPIRNYLNNEFLLNLKYLALPFEMFHWVLVNDTFPQSTSPARDRRVALGDFSNLKEIIINTDEHEDLRGKIDMELANDESITAGLEDYVKRNPGYIIPKWRLVRDRASLETVVERGLLT